MAYPILFYVSANQVSAGLFVLVALVLLLLRFLLSHWLGVSYWNGAFVGAAIAVAATTLYDTGLGARMYPVAVSLAVAATFGATLYAPPTLVERLARLREPNLSPCGVIYCRKVTWLWTGWLVANAIVAGVLAVAGTDAAWALWTGLLAYIVSGALLAGEWLVRRHVRMELA